ncbi:D-alanine--D-alanine ligase [Candidatus Endobugula sertula]|uniref:D-alanine--D-alanine ligase n=1 Tax=Candidatus Endobugula sertula TaxID=62101 RepID=A0A1D2QTQ2_9GAMM|nr:D-alanine--D-alanine ligase [Candidatus Endobugula sertula]
MKKTSDFANVGRVGVLLGGTSAERMISLESGQAIAVTLKNLGIDVAEIDVQENVVEQLAASNIDMAFIALHGGIGEDGRIQALLNLLGIPYTGSDTQASALAMNKLFSKQLWQGMGIPTSPFRILQRDSDFKEVLDSLGGSVIVKPVHEGSSIGMAIAHDEQQLQEAYHNALQYDAAVFAEKLLTGNEYTVGILNGQVLPTIKLETENSFYDYGAKYIDNETRYICPCGLSKSQQQQLDDLALQVFASLQCQDWGRVDIMKDEAGAFQVLEVNTIPGMTKHSLIPMAAKAINLSFDDLVGEVLQAAVERYAT